MVWTINYSEFAAKQLKKLDKSISKEITKYLENRITNDPKAFGKALGHDKSGLWRYRIGDYRVICSIENNELVVLVLRVAHRKSVYQD